MAKILETLVLENFIRESLQLNLLYLLNEIQQTLLLIVDLLITIYLLHHRYCHSVHHSQDISTLPERYL